METYFKNMTAEEGSKEKLIQDLRILIHDAEDLVKATGQTLADKSKRELHQALDRLKITCRNVEDEAAARVRTADRVVRSHPYEVMGLAFGIGVLIGVLLGRK